jgi:hypothetical protein
MTRTGRVRRGQAIARVLAAAFVTDENAPVDQVSDVALSSRHRAFGERRPFSSRQFAFEAIEKAIENVALTLVERQECVATPELGLVEDAGARTFGLVECLGEALDKPKQVCGDLEITLLGPLERSIVTGAIAVDSTRQAIEPLRGILRTRQAHIGKNTRDTAVSVFEGGMVTNHK